MVSSIQSGTTGLEWPSASSVSGKPHRPPNPEEMFKKIDVNNDGSVSSDELKTFAADFKQKTGQTLDVDVMLEFDQDGDGSLTSAELGQALKAQMKDLPAPPPGGGGQSPVDLFRAVDTDCDGKVSESELKSLLEKLNTQNGGGTCASSDAGVSDLAALMKSYDGDSDGTLSFDEFDRLLREEILQRPPEGRGAQTGGTMAGSGAAFHFLDTEA